MDIDIIGTRLSVRFNHVIFPIDVREFSEGLQKIGYSPLAQFLPLPTMGKGMATGRIAAKGNSVIDINCERQFIGLQNQNIETLIADFDELIELLKDKRYFGEGIHPRFIEFQGHFECWSKKNPLVILKKVSSALEIIKTGETIFDSPSALYHIRIVPAEKPIDSDDFYELIIEPNSTRPTQSYEIALVFRDHEMNKTIATVENVLPNITKIMQDLEAK
jgi:hypothetical protein